MQQQRGNFLLQAMLALGVIFAFVPFVARKLSGRDVDARMYSATRQIDVAQTAARIFIRENSNNISYETTVVSGNAFADLLEPYGLPLGFVPRTALGQDIALVIHKTPMAISAYLELTGGNLSAMDRAELARRIGFYADDTETGINVGIELTDVYSDVVRRNEPNLDNSGFLTELDMGGFSVNNIGNLFAVRGEFDGAEFNTLSITGIEAGRKAQNKVVQMLSNRSVFQSQTGESALSLTRGTLYSNGFHGKTVSLYGDAGNFYASDTSVYELAMAAGRTSFSGPSSWEVHGNVVASNINFSVERLDISSTLNASRGQDVFIDEETLEYSSKSGIEVDVMHAANITLRDQISSVIGGDTDGAVLLDVRPAGTSVLPDVLISDINNDDFEIISDPSADTADVVTCKDIITELDGVYNKQSLAQNLICQFVYWQRLEQRIDIKQCLMVGRSDCM